MLQSGTYYVAEDEGRLLGCGGWTLERPGTTEVTLGIAHLRHFATDPDFSRRGVGRSIVHECAQKATDAGAKILQVYSSLNAEPFYASLGLARVKRIELPRPFPVSFCVILMEGAVKVE